MCLKLFNMAAPYSIFRPNLFKNKVAIVTGGGTGIGKGITEELLHLGCKVVVASRNEERLRKAAEDMRNRLVVAQPHTGADLLAIPCNIRKENEVKNLMESTLEKFHKIDFLVNNGGGQYISHVEDISTKGWQAVIDTNLTGAFLMCREAFHSGMKENGGSIVNIIADMVKGMLFMGHSGAARAGVENMTKTMAIEWAKYGIRINCVLPGSAIYSESAAMNYGDPALFERLKPEIPARRLGTVQEVSAAVCFLLSPGASFVSGATLNVDSGGSLYSRNFFEIPDHDRWPAPLEGQTEDDGGQGSTPPSKL